jgi:probable rRNA maturation factor
MDDDGPSPVAVTVEAGDWTTALGDPLALASRAVAAARRATVAGTWLEFAEVSLLLTDDAAVRVLNARWRGQDRPTNVLSFPAHDLTPGSTPRSLPGPAAAPPWLGDVVLGFETVAFEAAAQDRPLADHVSHLVVHGTLHLLGYDHQTEADARVMEDLERRILAGLGVGDPYTAPAGPPGRPEMAR